MPFQAIKPRAQTSAATHQPVVFVTEPHADARRLIPKRKLDRALGCLHIRDFLQAEFVNADLPHFELLNLSGHGRGKDLDELPVVRDFEVRNPLFAEMF